MFRILIITVCVFIVFAGDNNAKRNEKPYSDRGDDNIEEAIVQREADKIWKGHINDIVKQSYGGHGFRDKDDFFSAKLGKSYRMYSIFMDTLVNYDKYLHCDITKLIYSTNLWSIPVIRCDGTLFSAFTIYYENGKWRLSGFFDNDINDIIAIDSCYPDPDGFKKYPVTTNGGFGLSFVAVKKDTTDFIVPAHELAIGLGLQNKDSLIVCRQYPPSEIMLTLSKWERERQKRREQMRAEQNNKSGKSENKK